MSQTIQKTVRLIAIECIKCGVMFAWPDHMEQQKRKDGTVFYCPNGHGMSWASSLKTETERLGQELSEAKERERRARQDAEFFKNQRDGFKGEITKLKRRAAAGICPCCNRHFANLERHVATKHPELREGMPAIPTGKAGETA